MNNINLNAVFQIGMSAPNAVTKIVEINLKITSLYFYSYKPAYNISEWRRDLPIPMSRQLFHDASIKQFRLKRNEITTDKIWDMINSLPNHYVLAMLSEVWAGKRRLYIPMMDFDENAHLDDIECFLRAVGRKGIILESGRPYHYHFYGVNLMTGNEWLKFMGDCLLSGLVEPRYIGHRLKDGLGILRISASSLRPALPSVVSIVTEKIPQKVSLVPRAALL